jgi:ATP phosphoribosyltransferase regulatory subunit
VLHTVPSGMHATREPLQFGAEIYGHAGLEADLEIQDLALTALDQLGLRAPMIDLADVRIVRALMGGVVVDPRVIDEVYRCLAAKDTPTLALLTEGFPAVARDGLLALAELYGGAEVLTLAAQRLPDLPAIRRALDDLAWLAEHLGRAHPQARIGFDLADLSGYAYYSGARFAIYAPGCPDSLVRGGRYDEVGAVFGRNRPAVGFSTDLKELVNLVTLEGRRAAIRAPWGVDPALRAAIRQLRDQGETVVCVLPGHEHEVQEFDCDRELATVAGQWVVRAL